MEQSMKERNEQETRERTKAVNEYMQSQMSGCVVENLDFRAWLMGLRCSIKEMEIAGAAYKVLYLGDKEITKWSDESTRQLCALSGRAIGLAVLNRVSRARIDDSCELPQKDISKEEFIHELQAHARKRCCR